MKRIFLIFLCLTLLGTLCACRVRLIADPAQADNQDELRRRKRFHPGGDTALPDTAGPDAYEHLPLREAIGRLPEELRSVVVLRFFSGYTQAETAAALNIPQGTAATRQKRALALLKLELGEEEPV